MNSFHLIIALSITAFAIGCVQPGWHPPQGLIYSSTSGVNPSTEVEASGGTSASPRTGVACATAVFSLVGWGDMSLKAAKKDGGIVRVDSLDYSTTSILLGLFQENCTVITGE